MAGGFKRGGSRGAGSSGGFKKSYSKKRAAGDEDDAPRASKKSKGDEEEDEEDAAPVIPKLQTDADNDPFIAVSTFATMSPAKATNQSSSTTAANDVSLSATSRAPLWSAFGSIGSTMQVN